MTTILGLLGALQGFILSIAVLSLGGSNRSPNRHIGGLLLILSIAVATISAQHGELFGSSIYPVLLEYVASILFPPLLWSYATTVLGIRRRLPLFLHFLPVLTFVLYLLAFTLGWTSWRWLPPILLVIGYAVLYTGAVAFRAWRTDAGKHALVSHHRLLKAVVVVLVTGGRRAHRRSRPLSPARSFRYARSSAQEKRRHAGGLSESGHHRDSQYGR